ncbi:MAG: polysaccharide deacetylase family protein [Gammaproteobacteria bacterium]|nr:polysaccharide deacetylase family protein [Gammaproteobacteria bacterium]
MEGEEFVVVATKTSDTLQSLAKEFLGDESRSREIARLNKIDRILPGQTIAIPLQPLHPLGIYPDGYQTIPILAYHRFGLSESNMTVTPESFYRQMAYLANNDFNVIPLKDLVQFLDGKKQLPPKSVVLTFDDGYKSFYMFAYPLMLKYGFPGTVFVYSDFVNKKAGLNWSEIKEMVDSGLIDVQPHSRFHTNLGLSKIGENETDYMKRIEDEITTPSRRINKHIGRSVYGFAYPYGDSNEKVIDELRAAGYQLAVTVQAGSNPGFAPPYLLKRTMVFGGDDMERFVSGLRWFEEVTLR